MSNLMVGIEGGGGASATRSKRRKLWRGIRRRLVRNLKRQLDTIVRMDAREAAIAEDKGYNPDLYGKSTGSAEARAIQKLLDRCTDCLDATV